ncbi:MAG: response regulator transcription factor [Planctomycetota bacterium]|nr:response regulator transcription factor [Planctomycetota bacterium]
MSDEIRVSIVEDQTIVREGLGSLIESDPRFHCSGLYPSAELAFEGIASDPPDVVLMDLGLPGMNGIEAIRRVKGTHPDVECVVLTVYGDDTRIFEALCAGACGYLLKKTAPEQLLDHIRTARDGGSPMTPEIARRVVRLFRRFRPPQEADYELTPHETRILKLLVDGHGYRTAAESLDISVNTVRYHIKQIYQKLQVHSKSEAVSKALRSGLLD